MKITKQKGFTVVQHLSGLVAIIIIGFAGWYVWNANLHKDGESNSQSSTSAAQPPKAKSNVTPATTPYSKPDGYSTFSDQKLGFSFDYPAAYGAFKEQPAEDGVGIKYSDIPASAYGPGIDQHFALFTHSSANAHITSRKYGPQIKLDNGRWIVTDVNSADPIKNTVGQEYKDSDGKTLTGQNNGGITVYSLKSGNEGAVTFTLVFVVKDKMFELQTPEYSDGLYGPNFGDPNAKANDPTVFNKLISNVRNSIRLL